MGLASGGNQGCAECVPVMDSMNGLGLRLRLEHGLF